MDREHEHGQEYAHYLHFLTEYDVEYKASTHIFITEYFALIFKRRLFYSIRFGKKYRLFTMTKRHTI